MGELRICLVGPSLQGNLALEYLEASVHEKGYETRLVPFEVRSDAPGCVQSVLEFNPHIVGISIGFQCTVDDNLELASLLRKSGYRGHLTCGGNVPTFCYQELLEESEAIDTAVRHEGEITLVEMLEKLAKGKDIRDIDGLVWREGQSIVTGKTRPLLSELDRLPRPLRRSTPLVVGGAPIAVMLASRGCIGECNYCCLRAFGKDAGGKRFRLRDVEAIADEIADVYHNLAVRIIIFQDDLFLMHSEQKSIDRMNAITRAIRARGVEKMLFWIKGRPETITHAVAEAASEMGAIHIFLGVENACEKRLRYLGRTHNRQDNSNAISRCLDFNIRSSFNIMMFDPDSTIEEISENIDFASEYFNLTWNICRTEIYPGTSLLERLKKEDRLLGDWRAYGYQMKDLRSEMMFRILRVMFEQHAFTAESLLNRLINLSFARHVHEELLPGPATALMSTKVDEIISAVYKDTVLKLREVVDYVSRPGFDDVDKSRDFAIENAMEINVRDHEYNSRIDEIAFLLDARGAKIRQAS